MSDANITNIGSIALDTITDDGGTITLDSSGSIVLDADSGDVNFKDGGVETLRYSSSASGPQFFSPVADKDIIFKGNDNGSTITALTLDMSEAGTATFNHDIQMSDLSFLRMGAGGDLIAYSDGTHALINANNGNLTLDVAGDIILDADGGDISFKDGGSAIGSISMANNDITLTASSDDLILTAADNIHLICQGNESGIDIEGNGAVTLYYDNSSKLATTSSGVTVSGGVDIEASIGPTLDFSSTYSYGPNRDWRFIVNNFGNGNWGGFSLEKSTAQGGTPSVSVFGIDGAGNMGLGVGGPSGGAQPQAKLDVGGTIRTSTGLLFGTDTAAANTLDDYEEGTWTPITHSGSWTVNSATYTKVGNMVTCRLYVVATSGIAANDFTGLPFTPAANSAGVLGYQNSEANLTYGILVQSSNIWNFRLGSTQKGLINGRQVMGMFSYHTTA